MPEGRLGQRWGLTGLADLDPARGEGGSQLTEVMKGHLEREQEMEEKGQGQMGKTF